MADIGMIRTHHAKGTGTLVGVIWGGKQRRPGTIEIALPLYDARYFFPTGSYFRVERRG